MGKKYLMKTIWFSGRRCDGKQFACINYVTCSVNMSMQKRAQYAFICGHHQHACKCLLCSSRRAGAFFAERNRVVYPNQRYHTQHHARRMCQPVLCDVRSSPSSHSARTKYFINIIYKDHRDGTISARHPISGSTLRSWRIEPGDDDDNNSNIASTRPRRSMRFAAD